MINTLSPEDSIFFYSESPTQYQHTMDLMAQRLPESESTLAALDRAVTVQASTLALNDIFYLSAAGVATLAVIAWLLPARGASGEGAH